MTCLITDSKNVYAGISNVGLANALESYLFYDKETGSLVGRFMLPNTMAANQSSKSRYSRNIWVTAISKSKKEMIDYMDAIKKYHPILSSFAHELEKDMCFVRSLTDSLEVVALDSIEYVLRNEKDIGDIPEVVKEMPTSRTTKSDPIMLYIRRK